MVKIHQWLELLLMLCALAESASVSKDDMMLDSLLPLTNITQDLNEGSGDYSVPIIPLTGSLAERMQRLEHYEGSGDGPVTAAVVSDPTEEGMEVLPDTTLPDSSSPNGLDVILSVDNDEWGSGDVTSHVIDTKDKETENTITTSEPAITEKIQTDEQISVTETSFEEAMNITESVTEEPINVTEGALTVNAVNAGVDRVFSEKVLLEGKEETVLEASVIENQPRKLGIYIVTGMVALTFIALLVYLTIRGKMKKQKKRRRMEFENQDKDTEKALINLHKFKEDNGDDNHIKNNEITPLVMKPTTIKQFEKSNFSLPKNLNTAANDKNIAKDNVLKSENLTQAIIEGSDLDNEKFDKGDCEPEKLIVRALVDNDSVPKKPIIVNRHSNGYAAVPQNPQDHT